MVQFAATPPRIPRATYRVQLNQSFTFTDAKAVVDHLASLGISHLYTSPFLAARPGSLHGYDIVDHARLNPEMGTEEELGQLVEQLHAHGMGMMMDVVPNHMCITDAGNTWWQDVLENGPSSVYARHFDVDWQPLKPELANQVLLPVLGDQFGRVLENGELQVVYERGIFWLQYWTNRWPLAPRSWFTFLEPLIPPLMDALGEGHEHVLELESILTALRNLPTREETRTERIKERMREKEIIKRRLDTLVEGCAPLKTLLHHRITTINGVKGDPHSFDALEEVLKNQAYRLSFWKVASDEINYRRFFDINELAALRVEDPVVFGAVHAQVLALLRKGWVQALRIDHVDGLYDPHHYLQTLQTLAQDAVSAGAVQRAALQIPPPSAPLYVVVEKIVVGNESIRTSWPIAGTTGYGFMNLLNGLFVDTGKRQAFLRLYERFTGVDLPFEEVLYQAKRLILGVSMSSELHVLARRLDVISEQHRFSRDFTLNSLRFALEEFIACFPVYRTYMDASDAPVDPADRTLVLQAIHVAKRRNPSVSGSLFDFLASVLLREPVEGLTAEHMADRQEFTLRLQQLTGPVMAKGMEDTAFYRYYPLASLNEVGGNPARFGVTVEEFHKRCQKRAAAWPHSLSATSTHDTKRGEDVRTRLDVLSEIPQDWYTAIMHWRELNRTARSELHGQPVPDPNEEYLIYQTLVGAWPMEPMDEQAHAVFAQRIQDYFIKAAREAKVHTSWINPSDEHEQACRHFIAHILDPRQSRTFLDDLAGFLAPIIRAGQYNSLAQLLIKTTAPGVPDFYQGTELWNLALVDPDNRRAVDYGRLRHMLQQMDDELSAGREELVRRLLKTPEDGAIKLYVTATTLRLRARLPHLFNHGDYLPLPVQGPHSDHVCAFARTTESNVLITVVGRFFCRLDPSGRRVTGARAWGETSVPLPRELGVDKLVEVLTDHTVAVERAGNAGVLRLAKVFTLLPMALLVGDRRV